MIYRLSAEAVLLLHFTFIAFVLFGAVLSGICTSAYLRGISLP